jgi:hypothetical protein
MTQVLQLTFGKGALLEVSVQLIFPQQVQNLTEMLSMLFRRLALDEDVVKVHQHKLVQVRRNDSIHCRLESCRSICQSKR